MVCRQPISPPSPASPLSLLLWPWLLVTFRRAVPCGSIPSTHCVRREAFIECIGKGGQFSQSDARVPLCPGIRGGLRCSNHAFVRANGCLPGQRQHSDVVVLA